MKEEQIINAARELFKNYGFKKVSMDEIARKAGVTKRTVYKYLLTLVHNQDIAEELTQETFYQALKNIDWVLIFL